MDLVIILQEYMYNNMIMARIGILYLYIDTFDTFWKFHVLCMYLFLQRCTEVSLEAILWSG